MKKMKKLLSILAIVSVVFAQDEAAVAGWSWKGELNTDITFGDVTSFTAPYTGVSLSGENWQLSSHLSNDNVEVEEAYYLIDANVTSLTVGKQRVPYGLATAWHRPSANSFVSEPSVQTYAEGIGASTDVVGVGLEVFYGNDEVWSLRGSYGLLDHTVGFSTNNNEGLLLDCSGGLNHSLGSVTSYFEYDLSEETSGNFWYRAVVAPVFTEGVAALVGYSSVGDETDILYGVGYQYKNANLRSELSADGDMQLRISYSF